MSERPANLRDVARRARVSSMTVSRALRSPDLVSAEARKRIERAVLQLDYVPDNLAGGLRSRRSRTIACIIPTIASPVFATVVQGLTDVLNRHSYRLSLGTSNYSSAEESRVAAGLLAHRPEALVLTAGDHRPELARRLARRGVPVVEIWERLDQPLDMNVGFSNEDAGRDMVRHLIARGARRIAFVGVTKAEHARARARRRGYETELRASLGQDPIVVLQDESIEGGRAALREVLAHDPAVDAIFCVGDMLAVGALLEATARGLDVPGRMMVAGFGNSAIGREVPPGLTTVHVPEYRVGQVTGELIVARLAGGDGAIGAVDVGFEIVARGSTARAAAR